MARRVDALRKLLDARTELGNLLTYMDGKSGAERLLGQLLADPELLKAVSAKAGTFASPEESAASDEGEAQS